MEKITSAVPFYYGTTRQSPNTVRISIEMEDNIEGRTLAGAVREAMPRYPYFCVKAAVSEREMFLEENQAEVTVEERQEPVSLGGAEANGHLLAFSWWENRIYLDFFHGLADAAGIFPLIKTVLYYYCREKYDAFLSPDGIRLKGEEIPAEEVEDPYPPSVDEKIQPLGKMQRKTALNLIKAGLCSPGKSMVYTIKIPEDIFMKYGKDRDGTPAVIVALLMARAIDSLHPDSSLPVICGMAMNIRKALGKPAAHHSLVSQLFLEYKESMKQMDTMKQATCFRGMIMVQGQDENILDSVRKNLMLIEKADCIPDIAGKRMMFQKVVSSILDKATFKVSYVGRSDMGAVGKYVKGIETVVAMTGEGGGIMLEVNAIGGAFHIAFHQEWEEDVYVRAFLAQLEKENIPFELVKKEELKVAAVELP